MVFCLEFRINLRKIIRRFLDSCNEIERVATKFEELQPSRKSCNEIPKVATKRSSLICTKKPDTHMCLVVYYLECARSFNERRKIFPVVFFGNSVKNSKLRGTLYFAKCSAQYAFNASAVMLSSFTTTYA